MLYRDLVLDRQIWSREITVDVNIRSFLAIFPDNNPLIHSYNVQPRDHSSKIFALKEISQQTQNYRNNAPQPNSPPHRFPPLLPPRLNPPNLNLVHTPPPKPIPNPKSKCKPQPQPVKLSKRLRLNVRRQKPTIRTPAHATGKVKRQPGGYGESVAHDGSAGRGYTVFGRVYGGVVYGECEGSWGGGS